MDIPMKPLRRFPFAGLAALSLLLAACAGDISPDAVDEEPEEPGETLPGPGGAQAVFTQAAAGHYHGVIDASGSDWIYIDLETQTQVIPANPAASIEWDFAFKGAQIKLNGGISGAPPSGNAVVVYGDKVAEGTAYPFETVDAAPPANAVAYVSDAAGALPPLTPDQLAFTTYPAADQSPNLLTQAGDYGWYRNSGLLAGSVISSRGNVGYVLRTVDCRYYKLRLTAYADSSGAAAHPAFDLLEIPGAECVDSGGDPVAPAGRASFSESGGVTTALVDASDEAAWVHLDLTGAAQAVPANPNNDPAGWDIALRRTDIKLNGGSSGAGSVEIHAGLRDDWAARSSVPAAPEWHTDVEGVLAFATYPPPEAEPRSECFNINQDIGWHYYTGFCDEGDGIHHIYPRDVVYIVHGRDGLNWKLRVLDYYDAAGESAHFTIEYAPLP